MHVITCRFAQRDNLNNTHNQTVSRRQGHPQASLGLQQCIGALGRLGVSVRSYMHRDVAHQPQETWPSAKRVQVLLDGATGMARDPASLPARDRREHKRTVEEALGEDMNSDVYGRQADFFYPSSSEGVSTRQMVDEDANTRAMLQSLGLHVPLPDPSMSTYLPDYQYWPRQTYDAMSPSAFINASGAGPSSAQSVSDPSMAGAPFTFNQNDLAPQFVQGVHFPVLDPSNLFPPDQRRGT